MTAIVRYLVTVIRLKHHCVSLHFLSVVIEKPAWLCRCGISSILWLKRFPSLSIKEAI